MLTNGRSNHGSACIAMRVTACLLFNEPTSYSYDARLSLSRDEAVAKASLNRANIVSCGIRETW